MKTSELKKLETLLGPDFDLIVWIYVCLYLRTAPQYLQSTRKIGLRALVTLTWDVCLIRTTMASTNCSSNTHVWTRRRDNMNNMQLWELNLCTSRVKWLFMPSENTHHGSLTFTMVLLCRMKVWKPNQRSFMHSSNATITKASSSRVAWTCTGIKYTVNSVVTGYM